MRRSAKRSCGALAAQQLPHNAERLAGRGRGRAGCRRKYWRYGCRVRIAWAGWSVVDPYVENRTKDLGADVPQCLGQVLFKFAASAYIWHGGSSVPI